MPIDQLARGTREIKSAAPVRLNTGSVVAASDKVRVEVSSYDTSRGRIIFRYR